MTLPNTKIRSKAAPTSTGAVYRLEFDWSLCFSPSQKSSIRHSSLPRPNVTILLSPLLPCACTPLHLTCTTFRAYFRPRIRTLIHTSPCPTRYSNKKKKITFQEPSVADHPPTHWTFLRAPFDTPLAHPRGAAVRTWDWHWSKLVPVPGVSPFFHSSLIFSYLGARPLLEDLPGVTRPV